MASENMIVAQEIVPSDKEEALVKIKVSNQNGCGYDAFYITKEQAREISEILDEASFRDDIINEVEHRIWTGLLPESARDETDWINDIISIYRAYRYENDGDSEGLDWYTCLTRAFNEAGECPH